MSGFGVPTPLAIERRALLLDLIRANPGINFHQLMRASRIASGTLRFHLNVLRRRHAIVEARLGWTVRHYAASHGVPINVAAQVVLREPPMARLAAWVRDHPDSRQTPILAAFAECGWSRSTTQHRLLRLTRCGVITEVRNGPAVAYRPLP